MKFSIGYQLPDQYDSIGEIVQDYRENISSVYFASPGQASARFRIDAKDYQDVIEELKWIRSLGVGLTLLFNANCYGENAVSQSFAESIKQTVGQMCEILDITGVTTTSPFVAKVVKKSFPHIDVCASVNMWIGTVQAMEYLGDDFDGFYMQREYNRNFGRIKQLSSWCKANGKKIRMLANSGCLYTCPFHIYHDNLVSHENPDTVQQNAMSKRPSPCWDLMFDMGIEQAAATFLQESWIRPEDIFRYEPFFDEIKLATRMHSNPRRVVASYAKGRFKGNMFDLTEPSFSRRFSFNVLDATLFPDDWFEKTCDCSRNCGSCKYCQETAKRMLINTAELEKVFMSRIEY